MTRRLILLAVLAAMMLGGTAMAKGRGFGLGIIAGEPTGPCFKLWTGQNTAVDGAVAWSTEGDNDLRLHADYLMHSFNLFKVKKGELPLYYGIGGRIILEDHGDDHIGARVPVGLAYIFQGAPIDLFFEIVPVLDLTPDTELDFDAALGVRFFFK